jgi:hypothetical protein
MPRWAGFTRPLGTFANIKPLRGVVTGCNDAFLIDSRKRAELLATDPRSAEIIFPYIRGQDVDRWQSQWSETWIIFTRRGINIDGYPGVRAHLTGGCFLHHATQISDGPKEASGESGTRKADFKSALRGTSSVAVEAGAPICNRLITSALDPRFQCRIAPLNSHFAWFLLIVRSNPTSSQRSGEQAPPSSRPERRFVIGLPRSSGIISRPYSSRNRALLHGQSFASRTKPAFAGFCSM